MDECPSWAATYAVSTPLPAENERSRMFSVPLQSAAALLNAVISQVAFFLNTHCVTSLPLFTCMSTDWLLCVFHCGNPSCYWSPPSWCNVALQCVLLLTMFNKYVNQPTLSLQVEGVYDCTCISLYMLFMRMALCGGAGAWDGSLQYN